MPAEAKFERRKVASVWLTPLARWILKHAGNGIRRSEVAEGFFGIARFYRGYYVDPCLTPREWRERCNRQRCAQPAITKALKRLELLGLAHLIRRRRYIKEIRLTSKGESLAAELNDIDRVAGHDD